MRGFCPNMEKDKQEDQRNWCDEEETGYFQK